MIRHVVLFKTAQDAPLHIFKEKIENLKTEIPEIINITAGIDIKFDSDSSDFCVITDVKNVKDLEIYAKHPEHLKVISYIKPYITERKVADFKV
jgi:hypothetical protein